MKSTTLELCSTTRESKVFASDFDPVLMPLNFSKLGMGNIIVPYLRNTTYQFILERKRKGIYMYINYVIYLFPARWPLNWAFISFWKRKKAGGSLLWTVPLTMFVMLGTMKTPNGLQIVKARDEIRPSR